VAGVTPVSIDEIDAIEGFFEGIKFHKAAAGLGVSSFGMSIIEMAPGADGLRLLALGGTPGRAYEAGGTL
jgi:hypothetical protein